MDKLPNKTVEAIFQYLDSKSLQNIVEVSKRFLKIIKNSPTLSAKLILNINMKNSAEMLTKSNKFPYQNVQISAKIHSDPSVTFWKDNGRSNVKSILTNGRNIITKLSLEDTDKFLSRSALLITVNLIELKLFSVHLSFVDSNFMNRFRRVDPSDRNNQKKLRLMENMKHKKTQASSDSVAGPSGSTSALMANFNSSFRTLTELVNNPPGSQQNPQPSTSNAELVDIPWLDIDSSKPSTSQPPIGSRIPPKNSLAINLRNLKFLEVKNSPGAFVAIDAPKLNTLIIHSHANSITISDFLMSVPELKSLTFHNFHRGAIRDCTKFPFSLKKFDINLESPENEFINLHEAVYVAEIIKFLKMHKNLEDLRINFGKLNNEAEEVISMAISDLKLRKFKIYCDFESSNFTNPKFNAEIQELSISGKLDAEHLKQLIKSCSELQSLELDIKSTILPPFINSISNYLQNLKVLSINAFIIHSVPATAVFRNVEHLKITNIHKNSLETAWYDLVMACPNVKKLSFLNYKIEISPHFLHSVLSYSRNLKILNIFCDENFFVTDEFLYIFLDDNLSICELNIKANNVNRSDFHQRIEFLTMQTNIKIRCMDL